MIVNRTIRSHPWISTSTTGKILLLGISSGRHGLRGSVDHVVLRASDHILPTILRWVRIIRIMWVRAVAAGGTVVSLSRSFRAATLSVVVVVTTIWESLAWILLLPLGTDLLVFPVASPAACGHRLVGYAVAWVGDLAGMNMLRSRARAVWATGHDAVVDVVTCRGVHLLLTARATMMSRARVSTASNCWRRCRVLIVTSGRLSVATTGWLNGLISCILVRVAADRLRRELARFGIHIRSIVG